MNLLPHQIRAADDFFTRDGRMLLWADTGTGKTAVAMECGHRLGAKMLYVCPAILKKQIASEWAKFYPSADVTVIQGTKAERRRGWSSEADVYICNFEQILHDNAEAVALAASFVVVDECQRLAAPVSKTLKAFRKLDPKWRLAMSGTPAPNHLHEFWNMTDWVSPGHFHPNFWAFRSRECRMNPNFPQIIGYFDKRRVQEKFMKPVHRIKREDVLTLPPLTDVRIECVLSEEQRAAYEKLKRELMLELGDGKTLTVPNMLALIMRLRQMADLPETLGLKMDSSKMKTLDELLGSISSRKVIIFSEFSSVVRYMHWKYGNESVMIIGDVPEKERQENLMRFKTDPKIRLLLMSSAGVYGLNCQEADTVIHFDGVWNAAREDQRNARAWRYGQTKEVMSYRIIAVNTIDEKLEKIVEQKKKIGKEEIFEMLG